MADLWSRRKRKQARTGHYKLIGAAMD
jgi:hypothetical protein